MNTCSNILDSIKWPTDILLLDFETYFADDYSLSKLSIVEYVTDPRFEFTGLGIQFNDSNPIFINGTDVPWAIKRLKKKFGKALHNCTVVAKNNKFDMLILAEKFGIYPPYTIDIEDLSRYYDSQMSQKLKDIVKVFKLQEKGDTNQFKNQYCIDINWIAMKRYCLNDVDLEWQLLNILLPMLDNPDFELTLAQHTLNLYLKPIVDLDVNLANELEIGMNQELINILDGVSWVLDYE